MFKSSELDEIIAESSPDPQDLPGERSAIGRMLAQGFNGVESDEITVKFGRRVVVGEMEDGSYRNELSNAQIMELIENLGEIPEPGVVPNFQQEPDIEIQAGDEILFRVERDGAVTANEFDFDKYFELSRLELDSEIAKPEIEQPETKKLDDLLGESGELHEFDSSVLKFGKYDPDNQNLVLEFQSGQNYAYFNVEPEVWQELKEADSAGQYFNQEIKEQYSAFRVGENLLEKQFEHQVPNVTEHQLIDVTNMSAEEIDALLDTWPEEQIIPQKETIEIPFLTPESSERIQHHALESFDTSSIKDFLNEEHLLTEQLVNLHRVDAGNLVDYDSLNTVAAQAIQHTYPEWSGADELLAGEIDSLEAGEVQTFAEKLVEEIDQEAREIATEINSRVDEWSPVPGLTPIHFQVTDTGAGDTDFLKAAQEYLSGIEGETDTRVLTEHEGLSPAEVLGQEVTLQDPNLSGNEASQHWLHETAQEIHQDVAQIRQGFMQQPEQQQALVEEVAPKLADILNELNTNKYEGTNRTIEFDLEQNQLTLVANATGATVMTAQWNADEKLWEDQGSTLTQDDREAILNAASSYQQEQKKQGREH